MDEFEKIGIIGCGTMGSAILDGLNNETDAFVVGVYDADPDQLESIGENYPVTQAESVEDLHEWADFLLLCVKPSVVGEALSPLNSSEVHLVSIAAGVSIEELQGHLGEGSSVVRVMPNTPAQVGEGMSFLAPGPGAPETFLERSRHIFRTVGEVSVVDESKMDAVTALSGSGPAYVFYFLEALQEAGVYLGLDADDALKAARKTIQGAAALQEATDKNPAELKSDVSSPGGTTVEALKHLDKSAVKGDIKEALQEAYKKSKRLSD
ncbi:MAG: pyrroline-5-carboxylate reductase [bacterium]